ncbi:PREDICTED: sugar transporter ERD6-like 17 isoform X1 [Tarenaya hassleriana]|uniref:sugar transporter ERD6-like 17 isoform X1 n=1 Tax=Tarenaya hassleriana TaxID=28532 RepID=UPI00053C9B19|nr:PREDICTED: sugar transporter ERD6-like 17 isoform X1 [Tarenaya hassleriana]
MGEERMEGGLMATSTESLLCDKDEDSGGRHVTAAVLFTTAAAVSGSISFGCAMSFSSAAKGGIQEDLGLSVAEYSVFGSILTFGATIGALFSGIITGLVGRKPVLCISQLFFIIGWLAIASAKTVWMLDFGRLCCGIAIGLLSYTIPVYIAEVTPKTIRGGCIFANQLLQNCGMAIMYSVGNFLRWRTLALISVLPCFVQLFAMFFVPESPRWLAKIGREKEFENSLQFLRGKDADISKEKAEIIDLIEALDKVTKSKSLDLFQKRYRYSLTVGIGLMLLQQLTGSAGIGFYASTIFEKSDFSVSFGSTALALVLIPKACLGLFLVDKWGRRPLLMVSATGACLSCLLLAVSFTLQAFELLKEITPSMAFVGVMGFMTTFALGFGGLPWIIMSEIFPMNIKVRAGSVAAFANWSTSWVITYAFNFLLEWSSAGTFYIFAGACGASILFVWSIVPETNGKTLEEIQASSILK